MKKSIFALIFALFFLSVPSVFAADTVIETEPSSGTFDNVVSVDLVIDGKGERFNAAEAKLELSNLAIEDLILGDCQFSFLSTPNALSPSFQGVLLGDANRKCTVYTLKLVPINKGEGKITISDASVKRYGDATEILSNVKNGVYAFTTDAASLNKLIPTPAPETEGELYTLNLKILTIDDLVLTGATVTLRTASESAKASAITDSNGLVQFSTLESGIYSALIEKEGVQLGENIINISGPQKVIILSIRLQPPKDEAERFRESLTQNKYFLPLLATFLFFGVGIIFLLLYKRRK